MSEVNNNSDLISLHLQINIIIISQVIFLLIL